MHTCEVVPGICGVLSTVLPNFATIACFSSLLCSKKVLFYWGEGLFLTTEAAAVEEINEYPDPAKQYILDTAANNKATDAVLSQMVDKEEWVVAHCSKTFRLSQSHLQKNV